MASHIMPHFVIDACDVRSRGALQEHRSGGQLLLLGGIDGMGLVTPRSEFQF
jgi:hypothetical protein